MATIAAWEADRRATEADEVRQSDWTTCDKSPDFPKRTGLLAENGGKLLTVDAVTRLKVLDVLADDPGSSLAIIISRTPGQPSRILAAVQFLHSTGKIHNYTTPTGYPVWFVTKGAVY